MDNNISDVKQFMDLYIESGWKRDWKFQFFEMISRCMIMKIKDYSILFIKRDFPTGNKLYTDGQRLYTRFNKCAIPYDKITELLHR